MKNTIPAKPVPYYDTGTGIQSAPVILELPRAVECRIISRVNRFVVEVEVGGQTHRAHITNTGRLEQFLVAGKTAYCLPKEKPARTDFLLFAIKDGNTAALIDTRLQMQAFEQAVEKGLIPWLKGWRISKRNARLGTSLIDYLLECADKTIYLEVKSAVLRDGKYAMYPDCPTLRGQKHIRELTDYVKQGGEAIIQFIAALPGVTAFKPYRTGNPVLCEHLEKANKAGVLMRAIQMVYVPADGTVRLMNGNLRVEV
ncbi:MAG: DNA/RNA nuclease SfsA [Dehalococcoidia bacterium]|nr:DNA/RNA nuclease SfsA [Dehalococcoidia bacterium]